MGRGAVGGRGVRGGAWGTGGGADGATRRRGGVGGEAHLTNLGHLGRGLLVTLLRPLVQESRSACTGGSGLGGGSVRGVGESCRVHVGPGEHTPTLTVFRCFGGLKDMVAGRVRRGSRGRCRIPLLDRNCTIQHASQRSQGACFRWLRGS